MITKDQQMLIFNTATLEEFHHLNFDTILYPSNIQGTETYIKIGKGDDAETVVGYELRKKHQTQKVDTIYFLPSDVIPNLPIRIINTEKVLFSKKAYNLVTKSDSMSIKPEQLLNWKQLIDYSGIPNHTNHTHYTLYKMKVLYARLKGQVYYRTITESAFGKDKYKETVRILLNSMCNLSDPTPANLFYRACHNKDVNINEMPDDSDKKSFITMCNMLMRIGDGTKILDNRARKTDGTLDEAHIGNLSVSFTHNVPSYYQHTIPPKKIFEEIFPYNVINRYYYNLYDGFLEANFPANFNYHEIAVKYQDFIKKWIKSCVWYEQNWQCLVNRYPVVSLAKYKFKDKEPRFKDHFIDFARCISHYAETQDEYIKLLDEEYKSHISYMRLIPNTETINEETVKDKPKWRDDCIVWVRCKQCDATPCNESFDGNYYCKTHF